MGIEMTNEDVKYWLGRKHPEVRLMKISELEGRNLDEWVARAEGHHVAKYLSDGGPDILAVTSKTDGRTRIIDGGTAFEWLRSGCYHPSSDWKDGGPIIEREGIDLMQIGMDGSSARWSANFEYWHEDREDRWTGPTALVAAMRAFVASKFGAEVPHPTHQG